MFSNFKKTLPATNRYEFDIADVDLSIVNAIRRIILSDIPVVGFDGEISPSLDILINNGPLHNEFMLHRFGLIPIHMGMTDTDTFVEDNYEFEIHVHNKTTKTHDVTSNDFKVKKDGHLLSQVETSRLFPADPITQKHILISRLRPDETLHVKGKAIKSTAKHHAGFSPVSLCTFSFNIDPALANTATGILEQERAYAKNAYGDPLSVHFEIECEGGLTPKYLVSKALSILIDKSHKVIEQLFIADSDYVKFLRTNNGGQFTFTDEDDTFGNFLQSTMHNEYVRATQKTIKDNSVSFVGYYCPHPLENTMVLSIHFTKSDKEIGDIEYITALKIHCEKMISYLDTLQKSWQTTAV